MGTVGTIMACPFCKVGGACSVFLGRGIPKRFALVIFFSRPERRFEMLLLMYFSIIKEAMGAAYVPPKPEFSTNTAMAILGSSLGAKAMKTEWSLRGLSSAVPVLPQIGRPGI